MRAASRSDHEIRLRSAREPSLQDTLDALNCPAAILNEAGRILEVSASWRSLLSHGKGVVGVVGENYLDVCEARAEQISGARGPAQRRVPNA